MVPVSIWHISLFRFSLRQLSHTKTREGGSSATVLWNSENVYEKSIKQYLGLNIKKKGGLMCTYYATGGVCLICLLIYHIL